MTYAASLGFFLAISLIPLATLLFTLLGLLLGSGAYTASLQRAISQIYPYLPKGFLADCIQNSRKVGGLSISWVVLLVGAHWGMNQLDRSLSHIFGLRTKVHRQTRKHPLLRRLAVMAGALLTLTIVLISMVNFTLLSRVHFASLRALQVVPPLFGLALTTAVLQYLPRRHVRFRHALLGALTTAILWGLARILFGYYLQHTPTWGILYGSLGGVMAALVFLYYSCAIFMLGAEVTAAFYRHDTTGVHRIPRFQDRSLYK